MLCFKVFNDLDGVFFGGTLRDNVYLCAHDAIEDVSGYGMTAITRAMFGRRTSIAFCKEWCNAKNPKTVEQLLASQIKTLVQVWSFVKLDWNGCCNHCGKRKRGLGDSGKEGSLSRCGRTDDCWSEGEWETEMCFRMVQKRLGSMGLVVDIL